MRYPECGALGCWLEALAPFYRRLGRYYGDSGIFVRRDVYERVGGIPDIPVMESSSAGWRGQVKRPTCRARVSSSRRWEGRPLRSLAEPGPVLILGTDSLTLPPDRLRSVTRVLKGERPGESSSYNADIVGSTDGGYVLLGL